MAPCQSLQRFSYICLACAKFPVDVRVCACERDSTFGADSLLSPLMMTGVLISNLSCNADVAA